MLQVVTAPTPWQGGLVAISSFGFGGSNVHAIVAGCVRPRSPEPRLLQAPQPSEAPDEPAAAVENGGTVIEDVTEQEQLFPPEVSLTLPCSSVKLPGWPEVPVPSPATIHGSKATVS
jgi:fatty acid synthase